MSQYPKGDDARFKSYFAVSHILILLHSLACIMDDLGEFYLVATLPVAMNYLTSA